MPDYKSMYYALAAQVANAIDLLTQAQQKGEECAMDDDKTTITLPTTQTDKPRET